MAWTADDKLRKCGGYADDEITHDGIPAGWETWLTLHTEGRRNLHMHIQFGSIGLPRDEAELIVASILDGLNGPHAAA